jgi:undecaprenyl-diphosphatase
MRGNRRIIIELIIMLAVTVAGFALILSIPTLVTADANAFLFVNRFYMPDPVAVFGIITTLGSVPVGLLWVLGLVAFRRRGLALYVLVAVLLELALVTVLKDVAMRPRPYETLMNVQFSMPQSGSSFPSGHAAIAFAVAMAIGVRERPYLPLLLLIAVAVAFSRVYIGVHYPLDVVAGSVIGAVIGLQVARLDLSRVLAALHATGERLGRRFMGM